jgi:hypothetical protein
MSLAVARGSEGSVVRVRLRLRWARRLWLERGRNRLRSLGWEGLGVGVVALDVRIPSFEATTSM